MALTDLRLRASLAKTTGEQEAVVDLFDHNSEWWHDVYDDDTLDGAVYRRREALALRWLGELPADAALLDAGCGAGRVAWALAGRGRSVLGVDPSAAMLARAQRRQGEAGARAPRFMLGEVGAMPLRDGSFPLVVALGLIPWLSAPEGAIAELARVAGPGGYLLITSDNALRLSELLDSRHLLPKVLRSRIRRAAEQRGRLAPQVEERRYRPAELRAMLVRAGCRPVREATVGFGPVKVLGRPVLPGDLGRRLDASLQRLADRRRFGLAWLGNHHVVLAQVVACS